MKRTIRLKESELKHMISESVKRVINEYVSMKHSGHNLDDYLDDKDFMEIVNRVVRMYEPEDFDENDLEYIDNLEIDIADLINDFVNDEAIDEFGYKYGETDYRQTASNIVKYIQEHLDELYWKKWLNSHLILK